jgi:hypothetical protein
MLRRYFLLACLFVAVLFPTATIADWQIGEYQMARSHAITNNVLQTRPSGVGGLSSFAFVGRVGGISLEATATLPDDLKALSMRLEYNASERDGSRLKVHLGDNTYSAGIYDWQLVPIAKFADSEFTGVVSLFGEKTDDNQFNIVYHPAFLDTLLGIRLLQADALLIDVQQFSHLPKFNGKVVLGEGETDFVAPSASIVSVKKIIDAYDIQSWVITDAGKQARVRVSSGQIDVDLQPYYHFWKSDVPDEAGALISEYSKLETLQSVLEENPSASKRIRDIQARMDAIEDQINSLEPKVIGIPDATKAVEDNRALVESINPRVFDALRTTDRYAALFRLAKQKDPAAWAAFAQTVARVSLPPIEAPNVWPRPK